MEPKELAQLLDKELSKADLNDCRFCKQKPAFFNRDRLFTLSCTHCRTPARGYISSGCIKSGIQARVAATKLIESWNIRMSGMSGMSGMSPARKLTTYK